MWEVAADFSDGSHFRRAGSGSSAKWNKIAERTRLVGAQDYVLPLPSQGALGGQSIKYLNLFDALAAL